MYKLILTDKGADLFAQAMENGSKIQITEIAVGDGGGEPVSADKNLLELKNEVYRTTPYLLNIESPGKVIIQAVLPSDAGDFVIREVGVYVADSLIAYGNLPDTVKVSGSDGFFSEVILDLYLIVESTENITVVSPGGSFATVDYVNFKNMASIMIGQIFPVATCWNAPKPDNSGMYKFVELTYGSSYNIGLLGNEEKSEEVFWGTKFLNSTAKVILKASPMFGSTINLLNTEKRYLRPSENAGDIYNDSIRNIKGSFGFSGSNSSRDAFYFLYDPNYSEVISNSGGASNKAAFFDASRVVPTNIENRPRTFELTYFMRIL